MAWGAFVWFLVSLIVSVALAPKPPKPRAATIDDFDLPTAELDRPLPVIFGTRRITGSNVVWYGDLANTRIKQRSLFSSTTVGFKYFLGLHFGLGYGPFDALTKIEVGDKEAWTGNVTANGNIDINLPELFGGDKKEGGLVGRLNVMMGADDQVANTYLDAVIDSPMPAFRGMFGLVWERTSSSNGYIGNSPYLKPWAITGTRILKGWHKDQVWYPDKAVINGTTMNPAHIVYQALTDPRFGEGTIAAQINEASFEAAADTLFDEGFGLNILWNQSSKVDDFVQIVIDHIGGVLAIDPANNQYVIKLFRADYDERDLDEYGPAEIDHMESLQTQSWGETVNELVVTYTDPDTLKSIPLPVQDLANIRNQGAVISEQIDRSGISDHDLMRDVAGRELAQRSTPLWRAKFPINRQFWNKTVGDVFKLTWPRPALSNVVMRVLESDGGALEDGSIAVGAIEDIYAKQGIAYNVAQPPAGEPEPPETPADADTNPNVLSINTNTPPADPAHGDRYFIPAAPLATGAWAGHETEIAEWDADSGQWFFFDVPAGIIIFDEDTNTHYTTDGAGGIAPFTGGGGGGGIASTGTPAAAARIVRSTDQAIAPGAPEVIVWDGQAFDTDDLWPNGSELGQAVANFDGQYFVSANVAWDDSTDGERTLFLRKNGTTIFASTRQSAIAGLEQSISSLIDLDDGDYVEVLVESDALASVDIVAGSGLPHFTISRLRTTLSPTLMRGATWVRSAAVIIVPVNDVALYFAKAAFIHSVTILGGPSAGDCVVDVWKAAIADYPPAAEDSIVGSSLPTIDDDTTYFDGDLDGWDREIAAGDVLFFHLESSTAFHNLFVQLEIRETE